MPKTHLYRPGGIQSEGNTPVPSDLGSKYVQRVSRELLKDAPDPDVISPDMGGRHRMDFHDVPYGDMPKLRKR